MNETFYIVQLFVDNHWRPSTMVGGSFSSAADARRAAVALGASTQEYRVVKVTIKHTLVGKKFRPCSVLAAAR